MTYSMDLLVKINTKTPFKTIKCSYTYNGMKATLVDSRDGQEYNIEIIPNGVTLCPEAVDDIVNHEAMEVQSE